MIYEVLLNCNGIKDTDDPSMLPRCQNCVEGWGAGTLQLTGIWLAAFLELYKEDLPTEPLFDKLNDANIVPPCPKTGARRYATTSWTRK